MDVPGASCWSSLFLSNSAFHNAGLIPFQSLPYTEPCAVPVLTMVMLLVLLGNTCFPLALRLWTKLARLLARDPRHRRVLELLLRHPRTCYTHMFPSHANRWLMFITPMLIIIQQVSLALAYSVQKEYSDVFDRRTTGQVLLACVFQSVSTRTAGFSVVDLSVVSPSSAFVFCVCMWISVSPVIVLMRSTTRSEGRLLIEYDDEAADIMQLRAAKLQQQHDAGLLRQQMMTFLSDNSVLLVVLLFVALLCEEDATPKEGDRYNDFLPVLFEFCSAYGTVGLSMSGEARSVSGAWTPISKSVIVFVMFLGRLRGLPEAIDPTISLHFDVSRQCGEQALESEDDVASSKNSDTDAEVASDASEEVSDKRSEGRPGRTCSDGRSIATQGSRRTRSHATLART
uniref:Uncharacterized protein n=1 Tax=Zooxanthella nutricula TaxID=1333877 RepID=A0A7S2KEW4_9DINO|mmetsp:Transcript_4633/g.13970  ORF Transcript_4633/g.13970 Transcript_4633/m.13970 type:complete len:399 (-) Transcript_4633:2-1198(-)